MKLIKESEENIEEENGDWETESDGNESNDSLDFKKEKKGDKSKKVICDSEEEESGDLNDSEAQIVEMMQNF